MKRSIWWYVKIIIILLIASYILYKIYLPIINILLPFILSLLFSYLLSPFVKYFLKRKISLAASVGLVYLIVFIIIIVLSTYLFPMIYVSALTLTDTIPSLIEKYNIITNELIIRFQISNIPDSIKLNISHMFEQLTQIISNGVYDILNIFSNIFSNFFYLILTPFITFYFLKDEKYIKEKLIILTPIKIRDESIIAWYQIDLVLRKFIRGELLISLIVGVLTTIGMYLIGVKYSLILGFIAGITEIIPYVGPFIGAIPAILVAFTQSPILAIKALIVFIVIQQLESGVISPKIIGKSVGFHPITVIFIILLAEQLFGVIGMFFAVPVASIIVVIFNRIMNNIIKVNKV